jgi:phosphoribosylamine-glycine ligase
MSIYIIGDGSREEVIAETLEKSKKVNNITISKYLPTK